MPFNPSPEVAVAREAASKLKAKAVVVVYVSEDGEKIGMASYGQDAKTCRAASELGDWLCESAQERTAAWLARNRDSRLVVILSRAKSAQSRLIEARRVDPKRLKRPVSR